MLKTNRFLLVALISMIVLTLGVANLAAADETQPANKEKKAVKIDPKIFDQYIGEYEVSPEFFVKIFKENDLYYTQATGQMKFEIQPESETKFFLLAVDATITFVKEDGKVTQLIIHQAGNDIPAKKIK